ncbi:MAG: hypothetical protein RIR48_2814 [Bacteroidota bacterium]
MNLIQSDEIYYQSISPTLLSRHQLDNYLAHGWFRMKQSIFTTSHLTGIKDELDVIKKVWWLRYAVDDIKSHRSHRKILNRAADFSVSIDRFKDEGVEEHQLYDLYVKSIHFDGYASLKRFLYGSGTSRRIYQSNIIRIREKGKLIGAGIFDCGIEAAASGIHFYDPAYAKYSLGKMMILFTINYMRSCGMKWYYPGYIVAGSTKMNYKLFLGEDGAYYYDNINNSWLAYNPSIKDEILFSEEQLLDYIDKILDFQVDE